MIDIFGKYQHERNENLGEYFKAIGVPFIPRKMMENSSPLLELVENVEEQKIRITTSTMLRTSSYEFQLGEQYEEHMPGGVIIRSTTLRDDNKLVTISKSPDGSRVIRTYTFEEGSCVLHLKDEESGTEAKRYFRKV